MGSTSLQRETPAQQRRNHTRVHVTQSVTKNEKIKKNMNMNGKSKNKVKMQCVGGFVLLVTAQENLPNAEGHARGRERKKEKIERLMDDTLFRFT